VRQAADARHRDGEVRVVGVGVLDALRLDEVEQLAAGNELRAVFEGLERAVGELVRVQDRLVQTTVARADAQVDRVAELLDAVEHHRADEVPVER